LLQTQQTLAVCWGYILEKSNLVEKNGARGNKNAQKMIMCNLIIKPLALNNKYAMLHSAGFNS
jgi:hypothetical protein